MTDQIQKSASEGNKDLPKFDRLSLAVHVGIAAVGAVVTPLLLGSGMLVAGTAVCALTVHRMFHCASMVELHLNEKRELADRIQQRANAPLITSSSKSSNALENNSVSSAFSHLAERHQRAEKAKRRPSLPHRPS